MITETQKNNRKRLIEEARARLIDGRFEAGGRFLSTNNPPRLCALGALFTTWILLDKPEAPVTDFTTQEGFDRFCQALGLTPGKGTRQTVYTHLEELTGVIKEELGTIEAMYEGFYSNAIAYRWYLHSPMNAHQRLLEVLKVIEDSGDGPLVVVTPSEKRDSQ